jgi:hypothetical protein
MNSILFPKIPKEHCYILFEQNRFVLIKLRTQSFIQTTI